MNHKPIRWSVRLAVAVTAFAVLSYEIALTRIFSVLFRSPYVFLILSIAVCGLGVGSALAALGRTPEGEDDERLLGRPLIAFALLLPLPLVYLLTVGKWLVAGAFGPAVALLTAIPYVAAGMFLSRAFRQHAADAGRLYCFDLTGAGLAALLTAQLLSAVGGLAVPLVLGLVTAVAAVPVVLRRRWWSVAAITVALFCFWLLGNQVGSHPFLGLPPVTSDDEARVKPLFQELADPHAGSVIRYTEWSPVARTDVVSNKGTDTLFIWTDGDVPTQMEPFHGDLKAMAGYTGFIGYLPYGLRPAPERVMCIGPGGGLDCLLALLGHAKHIEPVEINPAIARVTAKFRNFYGDLYRRPEIDPGLIIDEGRSYLSRSTHRYDVIYFALAKSATTQQGGMALVDNYLYTEEAFQGYWRHLTDKGLVALVMQNPALVDRCLVTAVSALRKLGVKPAEVADRLAYIGLPDAAANTTPYQYVLLLSRQPFSAGEKQLFAAIGKQLDLRYAPTVGEKAPYSRLREPGMTPAAFATAVADRSDYLVRLRLGGPLVRLRLSAVTDDRPFYADMAPGLNPLLVPLLCYSLLAGLVAVLAAVALCWRSVQGSGGRRAALVGLPVLYFAALGAGFLLVEVALVQKLVLVLGYPTLSLTVILFALLMGGAVGGLNANRGTPDDAVLRLRWLIPVLVLVQVAGGLLVPALGQAVLRAALPLRIAAVVAYVLPLGFLMGQPFPTGLRRLGERRASWVPMAWAVNGVLSVTGSVLAASVASLAGYRMVLLVGAIIYVASGVLMLAWRRTDPPGGN